MLNFQDEEILRDKLLFKLKSALHFVRRTCSIGSSNKINDIKDTGGWSYASHYQRFQGCWIKEEDASLALKKAPIVYNAEARKLQSSTRQWYFSRQTIKVVLKQRFRSLTPLKDEKFNLNDAHRSLLSKALLLQYSRVGNCGDLSRLLCKYLWERPQGVDTMQLVKCRDFDHAFVLINAKGPANEPNKWGDAWIVDPWAFGGGTVFHASEFDEQFKRIAAYAHKQLCALDEANYQPCQGRFDLSRASSQLEVMVTVKSSLHLYPSYGEPTVQSLEYYYEVCSFKDNNKAQADNFDKHRKSFKSTLDKIIKGFDLKKDKYTDGVISKEMPVCR